MDIQTAGITAIIGSIIIVAANLFIAQQNRKRDEIKERLEKLFLPMKRILQKPNAMQNNYVTFLELEKLYSEFEHMASPMLIYTVDDIMGTYHSLLREEMAGREVERKIKTDSFKNYKNISRNFNELMYDIYGIVDANTEELLRQYRGGFKLHLLNFIQSFTATKDYTKSYYTGYKDDC